MDASDGDDALGRSLVALPEELLLCVLAHLPLDALCRCATVSRRWRGLMYTPQRYSTLSFEDCDAKVDAAGLTCLCARAGGSLRTLRVVGPACESLKGEDVLTSLFNSGGFASLTNLESHNQHHLLSGDSLLLLNRFPLLMNGFVSLEVRSLEQAVTAIHPQVLPGIFRDILVTYSAFPHDGNCESAAKLLQTALLSSTCVKGLSLMGDAALGFVKDAGHALVRVLQTNTTLTHLELWSDEIGPEVSHAIADALMTNATLRSLKISADGYGIEIGDEAARAFASALRCNSTLQTLILSGYNSGTQITEIGACLLAEALKVNATLTKLEMEFVEMGVPGARSFGDVLRSNSALTSLNLSGPFGGWVVEPEMNIGNEGAAALADGLAENRTLTSLILSNQAVGNEGALALAESLRGNTVLVELRLDGNDIGCAGAAALSRALSLSVAELNLSSNLISSNLILWLFRAWTFKTTTLERKGSVLWLSL